MLLFMLYSGLRIGDVVKLERSRIDKQGRILVRMEKTRQPLYVRLPKQVVDALNRVPKESRYFFWSGKCALATATGSARRTIDCLGRMTGIDAHPHRFRDTFSVELLLNGTDLRTVQKLLGHTSIRTTENHYGPWVQSMQRQLDEATATLTYA